MEYRIAGNFRGSDLAEIRFLQRNLLWIACWCHCQEIPHPPISRRKLSRKFSPSKVFHYMIHSPQHPVGLHGYLTPPALYPFLVTFSTVGIAIQTYQHQPSLPVVNIYLYFHNQFHHFHQCNFYSHHNVWRRGYTDHCCIGMLHCDRNLYKLYKASSDIASSFYVTWASNDQNQNNLLQFLSSLPSEHDLNPVHREEEETHWPLVHRNWVELQPRYSNVLGKAEWVCM